MSLEQKVGQLFVAYVTGATADTASQENLDRFRVATPAEAVQKLHLGGVIIFAWSGNTADPEQIAALSNGLQRAALAPADCGRGRHRSPAIPLTIATDQETGLVARVQPPATQFPGAMALAAGRPLGATRTAFAITGAELAAFGINTDYAPVADVNVNPANPVIGVRSFSSSPQLVGSHVGAAVDGLQQDADISAAAKHFPGHGDTGSDRSAHAGREAHQPGPRRHRLLRRGRPHRRAGSSWTPGPAPSRVRSRPASPCSPGATTSRRTP